MESSSRMPVLLLLLLAGAALSACTNTALTPAEITGGAATDAFQRADDGTASTSGGDEDQFP
jgi:hypothetical protein